MFYWLDLKSKSSRRKGNSKIDKSGTFKRTALTFKAFLS